MVEDSNSGIVTQALISSGPTDVDLVNDCCRAARREAADGGDASDTAGDPESVESPFAKDQHGDTMRRMKSLGGGGNKPSAMTIEAMTSDAGSADGGRRRGSDHDIEPDYPSGIDVVREFQCDGTCPEAMKEEELMPGCPECEHVSKHPRAIYKLVMQITFQ